MLQNNGARSMPVGIIIPVNAFVALADSDRRLKLMHQQRDTNQRASMP